MFVYHKLPNIFIMYYVSKHVLGWRPFELGEENDLSECFVASATCTVRTAFLIAILYIQRKITHTSRLASAFINKRVNNETIYWELLN